MALAGCGARTGTIDDLFDATVGPRPQPEMCNGLDDDLNTIVDDGFRDELGRYVQLEHCGFCRQSCPASLPHALGVACELIEETPSCVAIRCADGFARSTTGQCIPAYERLCLGCADDGDCGDFPEARCADIGGERAAGIDCARLSSARVPAGRPPPPPDGPDGGVPDGGSRDAGPRLDGGADDSTALRADGQQLRCDPGERFDVACGLA